MTGDSSYKAFLSLWCSVLIEYSYTLIRRASLVNTQSNGLSCSTRLEENESSVHKVCYCEMISVFCDHAGHN